MTAEIKNLIDDTVELTGAAPPTLLDENAPVLSSAALCSAQDAPLYLVGLIGGKEVGKSTLINALVGQTISEQSNHGAGTEEVIAYAHHSAAAELRSLLDREVSGRYRIIPHNVNTLSRQVLVDLPDIDSHWTEHVALTRRMLRHLLYPLWIQSIEKYADLQPQKLLAQVAAGNDPDNFIFCLNKADQLISREGQAAGEELRADYARRLEKTLSLSQSPKVYLISAAQPQVFDMPALGTLLSSQKTTELVRRSQALAGQRQDRSLLSWLDTQQLPARSERAARLLGEAEELLSARLGVPLLEQVLPRLMDDAGHRLSVIEPVVGKRLSRWPLVNVLHTALMPVMAIVQRNAGVAAQVAPDAYLRPGEQSIANAVQAAFALLHQSNAAIGPLYREQKLWDDLPAAEAADALRRRLSAAIERQRQEAIERVASPGLLFAPLRWLLTIGALIWFPIAQPLLAAMLAPAWTGLTKDFTLLAIELLSAAYLLKSIAFLMLYYIVLWALLRWDTHRRVSVLLNRWLSLDADPALSLSSQATHWIDDLLTPIRQRAARAKKLTRRMESFRQSLSLIAPDAQMVSHTLWLPALSLSKGAPTPPRLISGTDIHARHQPDYYSPVVTSTRLRIATQRRPL